MLELYSKGVRDAVARGCHDTAFRWAQMIGEKGNLRAGESGVALRFPPQSKMRSVSRQPPAFSSGHSVLLKPL